MTQKNILNIKIYLTYFGIVIRKLALKNDGLCHINSKIRRIPMRKRLVFLLIGGAILAMSHPALADDFFAPLEGYTTGKDPWSITTGDFNGDGIIDTATANLEASSVSVLLGNGDGTFKPQKAYGVGTWPVDITTGDFNGDGKLDIATAKGYYWYLPIPLSFYSVSVLIGNGDGTFQPAVGYGAGLSSSAIVSRDFNGDGKVDLAATNNQWQMWDNSISVFMGNGDGTFQASTNITTGYEPGLILASDFDKDERLDIVTMNGDATATVLIGNGDGTFQPFSTLNVENVTGVVSGDFNGDGNVDLVVGYSNVFNAYDAGISILLGNGDGTFQMKRNIQATSSYGGLAAGDFNNDGKTDVTTSNYVFIGNGDGTFQEGIGFYSGRWITDVSVSDFNSDGKDDIAVSDRAGEYSGSVAILLNIHNASPRANAGPDQTIECAGPSGSSVMLDAFASSDPDGDPLTYTWTWDGGSAEGATPSVTLPLGTTVVTLTVSDGKATATDTVNITAQDKTPPVTTATGGGYNWYNANVISSFSATDSCSGVKAIHYTVNGTETVVSGDSASLTLTTDGIFNIAYYSIDNAGNAESPNNITVKIDKTPPVLNLSTDTNTLWPPNHKMADVTIGGNATDATSGIASVEFTVTDEYGTVQPSLSDFNSTIQLEAWREGTDKDGRHFTITAIAADAAGNKTTASTTVLVPHDQRN